MLYMFVDVVDIVVVVCCARRGGWSCGHVMAVVVHKLHNWCGGGGQTERNS